MPKLELILSLVCRDYLADQAGATPVDLFGNNNQCNTPEVSALATKFTLVLTLVSGFLSALVSPKYGALSDRYGRKRLLAITTSGGVLSEIVTIIAATNPDSINYRILILGAFFEGICGSFIAGMAITHSYAADCTPPAKRAVAFGYFHACLFGGIAFGPLLAGVIIKATGQILVIFYIALGAHLIFLTFLLLVIPESLPKKRQMAAREKYRMEREDDVRNGKTASIFHAANILAPLKILYPTGPGSSPRIRTNLVLLSAVDTILFGTAMGAMTVTIYYSKLAFTWDAFRTNIFVATLNSCRVSALIIILPTLNYIFRTRVRARARRASGVEVAEKQSGSDNLDLNIIRFSVFLDTLGYIGYATVRTGGLFTASGILASVGGMGSPTLQSALTKHVPQDRVGQLLGATGLLHALARIISPTVFSLLYASTVKTMPQAVFIVLACCFAMAFVVSWFVKPHGKFCISSMVL